jgi:5'-nucleotidase
VTAPRIRRAKQKAVTDSLVIAVSARVLFDLEESNELFLNEGIEAYSKYQRKHENAPLGQGAAFHLVKGLLELNRFAPEGQRLVEVMVLSSIHPDAALRIINSISHYGLDIKRAAFTGGADISPYLDAFDVDLLLSRNKADVQKAVDGGVAAALMYAPPQDFNPDTDRIKIAFDGDAVIFSEESERIYQEHGLEAFQEHERQKAKEPMTAGPFAKFLQTLARIQDATGLAQKPFRIAIVTARGGHARERVLRTLRAWNISVDEVFFLAGLKKDRVLGALKPHIFFDDQDTHVAPASKIVPSGKVPLPSASPLIEIMERKNVEKAEPVQTGA